MIELPAGTARERVLALFEPIPFWKAVYLSAIERGFGTIAADRAENPNAAVLFFGGLVVYAGDFACGVARDLVKHFPVQPLVLGFSEGWNRLLTEIHGEKLQKSKRYHAGFDRLNPGTARAIAAEHAGRAVPCGPDDFEALETALGWEHQKYHYAGVHDFLDNACAYLVKDGDRIVSGASAFIRSRNAADCQISTVESERRKGLAAIAGAFFICSCLDLGVELPWDAANEASVRLAQRLGYENADEYTVYRI